MTASELKTMARIYLDHNATSPMLEPVRQAVIEAMDVYGNPSSVHKEGRAARSLVEQARRDVAALVGGDARCVTFTSGASEANMLALTGAMQEDYQLRPASHLYMSAIEHPSVAAGGRFGEDACSEIAVTRDGVVDLNDLERLLQAHDGSTGRAYVAVMAVNSETGVIQPIEQVAALAKAHDAYCHIDAVQAAGRIKLDMTGLDGCTSVALSAHKLGGPKGVGALVMAREGLEPAPLMTGGPQENRVRAGTENVPAIAGFGAAALAASKALEDGQILDDLAGMRDTFEADLAARFDDLVIFGASAERVATCSQFAIPGMRAETVLIQLDLAGIAVSSGSACSSGKVSESHVLKAMGYDGDIARAAIRVSLARTSKQDDLTELLRQIGKICAKNSNL